MLSIAPVFEPANTRQRIRKKAFVSGFRAFWEKAFQGSGRQEFQAV
jgi:hypothetical protein